MKKIIVLSIILVGLSFASCVSNHPENLVVRVMWNGYELPDKSETRADSIMLAFGNSLIEQGFQQTYAPNVYSLCEKRKLTIEAIKKAGQQGDRVIKQKMDAGEWSFTGRHICELNMYDYVSSDSAQLIFCSEDYGEYKK